ncbi:MAG TPA: LON peptidase substrate-binding domain-containing protein [Jatrophihabitans sp.]|uniref:LON peptidase substrate-binding domain-containing protein n=1 Tax=Jatrophihabitans sp. TaxID=1932789 RepID=UPI002E00C0C5|nr:LON peptidase substrate-binding domain-containing protein [Jatrophihabitans sp.]
MAEAIPLFPLSHVLLPGMPLPLHIFEQRYRRLLEDVSDGRGGGRFGVVALRKGAEAILPGTADDGPDVEPIGTIAEIIEVEPQHDGTSDLLCVGSRRFRITTVLPEGTPYLRAEVEYLDEPDGDLTPELETRARELIDVYDTMLTRIAGRGTGAELPDDANQLSYHLAARLPLPPGERQELLTDSTTAERLKRVARLLRREIALLGQTRSIAVSPTVLRMGTASN